MKDGCTDRDLIVIVQGIMMRTTKAIDMLAWSFRLEVVMYLLPTLGLHDVGCMFVSDDWTDDNRLIRRKPMQARTESEVYVSQISQF